MSMGKALFTAWVILLLVVLATSFMCDIPLTQFTDLSR